MKRLLPLLAAGFSVSAIYAQTCPSPNFLQGSTVTLFDLMSVAGLQRQPDGSFTRQRYQIQSPHKKLDSTPNYQSAFLNCSRPAPVRSRRRLGGFRWRINPGGVADCGGLDFLGNGHVGRTGCHRGGPTRGPSADSLLVWSSTPTAACSPTLTIRSPRTRKVCRWRT